ncbi:MAG: Flagellar assembly protein H [Atopobium sp.]
MKQIDLEEMLEHRLFILLPFWFMRYEGSFEAAARDSALAEQLLAECRTLQMRFAEALHANASEQSLAEGAEGSSTFQRRMTELIIKVSDHLLQGYEPLQREVREAMGVKILKFADERYAEEKREADEKYAEREQKAREESHKQGLEQGAELERRRLADSLRSRGFDEPTIDEVLSFGRKDDGGEGPAVQQA